VSDPGPTKPAKTAKTWAEVAKAQAEPSAKIPNPIAVPQPSVRPASTVTRAIVPCGQTVEQGFPLGFENEAQFKKCMEELRDVCKKAGLEVVSLGVRGSSATYWSENPNKKGQHFDSLGKNTSDIDAFFVAEGSKKFDFDKKGFAHPRIFRRNKNLRAWSKRWTKTLGRKIEPAAFHPEAQALKESHIGFK
jgi:hypothetical protein